MPLQTIHFDYQPLGSSNFNAKTGTVKGVTVITCGVQAKGHNLITDPVTLEQILASAEAKGNRIVTKLDHKTGIGAVNGALVNFYIEDDKLKADWELLQTHPTYKHTVELCTKMSDLIGLSASFTGEGEQTAAGKAARCKELISVDLVAHPAANPDGLFEAKEAPPVDKSQKVMATKTTEQMLEEILAAQSTISERLVKIEEFNADIQNRIELDDQGEEGEEGEEAPTAEELEQAQALLDEARTRAGGDEGEDEEEGDEANPQLAALMDRINNLEQVQLDQLELEERNTVAEAFAILEEKMTLLAAQRDEALARLESFENPRVQASPEGARMFSRNAPGQTEWQQIVNTIVAEDKRNVDDKQKYITAVQFAIKNHPGEYETHLAVLGGGETNLERR